MLDVIGLTDVWKLFNPANRNDTWYSNLHKSYRRIDFFLVPRITTDLVQECTIGSIHISNPNPVSFQLPYFQFKPPEVQLAM